MNHTAPQHALKQQGIRVITRSERAFAPQLRSIPEPPRLLYIQGDPAVLCRPAVSIVGSRQATEYGKRQTRRFAERLAQRGVVIVSGLAYGIDFEAHQTALRFGPTVAVVAGGLDVALLSWQEELAKKIIEAGGAVVSEYPLGVPALKHHFPERNRIIAGLSPVTLVTEAREHSGALITARLAAEAGRTVMVVPHDVERASAAGSNRLMREGAQIALEPRDVLEELLRRISDEAREVLLAGKKQEQQLLDLLAEPRDIEQLCAVIKKPMAEILRRVTELQLDQKIMRMSDGRFVKKAVQPVTKS